MKLVTLKKLGLHASLVAAASLATFLAVRARAAGIPDAGALTYTGYLENPDGTPVTGQKGIGLSVYDAEVDGNEVCGLKPANVEPVAGRFQLALPEKCTLAVKANSDLWVEIQVEGSLLGRTKLGAVPYAVEANHAATADDAGKDSALDLRLMALEGLAHPPSAFRATLTTANTKIDNFQLAPTKVVFNKVEFDLADEYSAATGVFQPVNAGYFTINCSFEFSDDVEGTWAAFILNGSTPIASAEFHGNAIYGHSAPVTVITKLAANAQVTCAAYQISGVQRTLTTSVARNSFSAARLY